MGCFDCKLKIIHLSLEAIDCLYNLPIAKDGYPRNLKSERKKELKCNP